MRLGATRIAFLTAALLCASLLGQPDASAAEEGEPTGVVGLAVGLDALRWQSTIDLHDEFRAYAALGVRWLRTDLNWSVVQESGPDSFDWGTMDRIVELSRRYGIHVLPVVGSSPRWAWQGPGPSGPADVEDFARFMTEAVRRYAPMGIRHWQIWNEPNMGGSWPPEPDPVAYARLLKAAYPAIKAADPEAVVIFGGLASVPETGPEGEVEYMSAVEFLRTVYAEGAGNRFDVLGFHPYSYPEMPGDTAPWNGWRIMEGPIRDVLEKHKDSGKQVWITEYGAPTTRADGGVSEAAQARMMEDAAALMERSSWIGPLFWYSYQDLGTDPADREHWFGLRDYSGAAKPSYEVFRRLLRSSAATP
jgi:polysaccharide biosynthesis protein PslG